MSQHTPNCPTFHITEDDLTNAIFDQCALESRGSGTKEDARNQARTMLAALYQSERDILLKRLVTEMAKALIP